MVAQSPTGPCAKIATVWPGLSSPRSTAPNPVESLLIPQAAVQRDQKGDFVLVVSSNGTVTQRHVTLGQQVAPDVVVEEGLQEGEAVIVEGLQKVRPGAQVEAVIASDAQE